jgi:hypothetical protein
VLHHHHRVCAQGHRRAGHDFDGFTLANGVTWNRTRANLARESQRSRKVRRANRKSVARRAIKRRIIAVCGYGFGEHSSSGVSEPYFFGRNARPHLTQHARAGIFEREG